MRLTEWRKTVIWCTGWPKKVSHKVLSISLPNIDRFSKFFHWCILWKISSKVVTKHTYHHALTASLHYLVKHNMCKIHQYLVKIWTRVWSLIFWPILKVKLRFVLDRLSVFVNLRRRYCHTGWAKKLSSKLLLIYSPNSKGFYIFHISQGSVATQLKCGGMQIFHKMC